MKEYSLTRGTAVFFRILLQDAIRKNSTPYSLNGLTEKRQRKTKNRYRTDREKIHEYMLLLFRHDKLKYFIEKKYFCCPNFSNNHLLKNPKKLKILSLDSNTHQAEK